MDITEDEGGGAPRVERDPTRMPRILYADVDHLKEQFRQLREVLASGIDSWRQWMELSEQAEWHAKEADAIRLPDVAHALRSASAAINSIDLEQLKRGAIDPDVRQFNQHLEEASHLIRVDIFTTLLTRVAGGDPPDSIYVLAHLDAAPPELAVVLMAALDELHRAHGGGGLEIRAVELGVTGPVEVGV